MLEWNKAIEDLRKLIKTESVLQLMKSNPSSSTTTLSTNNNLVNNFHSLSSSAATTYTTLPILAVDTNDDDDDSIIGQLKTEQKPSTNSNKFLTFARWFSPQKTANK